MTEQITKNRSMASKLALTGTALALVIAGGFGLANSSFAQDKFANADSVRLAHAYGGGGHGMRGSHRGGRWGHRRGGRKGMRRMRAMLENYDRNKDQKLTFEELETGRKAQVGRYDRDGSGSLDLNEFAPLWAEIRRQRIIRTFQRLDRDGDGKVTEEEFVDPALRMARRLDRNGDGAVSREDRRRRGWGRGPRDGEGRRGGERRGPDAQ